MALKESQRSPLKDTTTLIRYKQVKELSLNFREIIIDHIFEKNPMIFKYNWYSTSADILYVIKATILYLILTPVLIKVNFMISK